MSGHGTEGPPTTPAPQGVPLRRGGGGIAVQHMHLWATKSTPQACPPVRQPVCLVARLHGWPADLPLASGASDVIRRSRVLLSRTRPRLVPPEFPMCQERILLSGTLALADSARNAVPLPDTSGMSGPVPSSAPSALCGGGGSEVRVPRDARAGAVTAA
eukprot:CAMPEP_0174281230 /NCGR_PEP_ID=MMETSP0809-20121228/1588_1 /TAXON_ID=73025 ORGANISM="Eutreptiella gymnastica-like, Strain CCMP1594" /NCGR_SAMPLE_ID=MMETSP0809 /ASSEMBLY_ACC=CAM_ASM_000658 /LENGTH=158 /DNA_ID=CAMNT_0015374635 /DNA_START=76 /DNA_END=548 /DNA_ORIENTATION=-